MDHFNYSSKLTLTCQQVSPTPHAPTIAPLGSRHKDRNRALRLLGAALHMKNFKPWSLLSGYTSITLCFTHIATSPVVPTENFSISMHCPLRSKKLLNLAMYHI